MTKEKKFFMLADTTTTGIRVLNEDTILIVF